MHKVGYGGRGPSMTSLRLPLSPNLHMFTNREAPECYTLGIFMEALSGKSDGPLPQFAAPLQRMGDGAESFKLLIMAWSFWAPAPYRSPAKVVSLEQKTFLSSWKFQGI